MPLAPPLPALQMQPTQENKLLVEMAEAHHKLAEEEYERAVEYQKRLNERRGYAVVDEKEEEKKDN